MTNITAKGTLLDLLIGAVIAIVGGVVVILTTGILKMVCGIPGLKRLVAVREEAVKDLVASTKDLPSYASVVTTLDGNTDDSIIQAKTEVRDFLVSKGLSSQIATASASKKMRLVWEEEEWERHIKECKEFIRSGVEERTLSLHLKLTVVHPSYTSLQNLQALLESGLEDFGVQAAIIDNEFTVEETEEVIRKATVDLLDWDVAVRFALTNKLANGRV